MKRKFTRLLLLLLGLVTSTTAMYAWKQSSIAPFNDRPTPHTPTVYDGVTSVQNNNSLSAAIMNNINALPLTINGNNITGGVVATPVTFYNSGGNTNNDHGGYTGYEAYRTYYYRAVGPEDIGHLTITGNALKMEEDIMWLYDNVVMTSSANRVRFLGTLILNPSVYGTLTWTNFDKFVTATGETTGASKVMCDVVIPKMGDVIVGGYKMTPTQLGNFYNFVSAASSKFPASKLRLGNANDEVTVNYPSDGIPSATDLEKLTWLKTNGYIGKLTIKVGGVIASMNVTNVSFLRAYLSDIVAGKVMVDENIYITGNLEVGDLAWLATNFSNTAVPNVRGRRITGYLFNAQGAPAVFPSNTFTTSGFANANLVEAVVLPASVTDLGIGAFQNCTALTQISAPGVKNIGIDAFKGAANLETVVLKSAEVVGANAFEGCILLPSIDFPNVKSIGNEAFKGCTELLTLNQTVDGLFSSLSAIGERAFQNCLKLTGKMAFGVIQTIGQHAFANTRLQEVVFNTTSTSFSIANNAFESVELLSQVTFPATGKFTIGADAFKNSADITKIDFRGASFETKERAFVGCTGLEVLATELSPRTIRGIDRKIDLTACTGLGVGTFGGLKNLDVVIGDPLTAAHVKDGFRQDGATDVATSVARVSFSPAFYNNITAKTDVLDNLDKLPRGTINASTPIKELNLANFAAVPANRFTGKTSWTQVTFTNSTNRDAAIGGGIQPAGVVIGDEAFLNCTGLNTLSYIDKATDIGARAFKNGTAIAYGTALGTQQKHVYLLNAEKLGVAAFANCTALTNVSLPSDVLVDIPDSMFYNCTALVAAYNLEEKRRIHNYAFYKADLSIAPTSLNSAFIIGDYAFYDTKLTRLATLKSIGVGISSFLGKESLAALTDFNVGTVGDSAFKTRTLPQLEKIKAEKIGQYAFAETKSPSLEALYKNSDGIDIGDYAFVKAEIGGSQFLVNDTRSIGVRAFNDVKFAEAGIHVNVAGLPAVIKDHAFYNALNMKTLFLGIVSEVGVAAFAYSHPTKDATITTVSVSDNRTRVTTLGDSCFAGQTAMAKANLFNVSSIGESSFANCSNSALEYYAPKLATIGNHAFDNTDMTEFYVNNKLSGDEAAKGFTAATGNTAGKIYQVAFLKNDLQAHSVRSNTDYTVAGLLNCGVGTTDATKLTVVLDGVTTSPDRQFDGKVLYLDHSGSIPANAFYNGTAQTSWYTANFPKSTFSIGNEAFMYCTGLTYVPNDFNFASSIGHRAFNGCEALLGRNDDFKAIELADVYAFGFAAFQGCSVLPRVILPAGANVVLTDSLFRNCIELITVENLTNKATISKYAFQNTPAFTTFTGTQGTLNATYIGRNAFDMTGLTAIKLAPTANATVGDSAFTRSPIAKLEIASVANTVSLGTSAFQGIEELTTIDLTGSNASTIAIGDYVFDDCSALTASQVENASSIKNAAAINAVGNYAFNGIDHSGFTGIDFPNCLTVGTNAFDGTSLKVVKLATVTTIGENAFDDVKLDSLHINSQLFGTNILQSFTATSEIKVVKFLNEKATSPASYGTGLTVALNGVAPATGKVLDLRNYGSLEIPSNGFSGSQLSWATAFFPTKAFNVGHGAFKDCSNLALLTQDGTQQDGLQFVQRINYSAFMNCKAIPSVDLSNITFIGDHAFMNCEKLVSAKVPSARVPYQESILFSIGVGAFENCDALKMFDLTNLKGDVSTRAFFDCLNLSIIYAPAAGFNIGNAAFGQLPRLNYFDFNRAEVVGEAAFISTSLYAVTIGAATTHINKSAFTNCVELGYIEFRDARVDIAQEVGSEGPITDNKVTRFISNNNYELNDGLNVMLDLLVKDRVKVDVDNNIQFIFNKAHDRFGFDGSNSIYLPVGEDLSLFTYIRPEITDLYYEGVNEEGVKTVSQSILEGYITWAMKTTTTVGVEDNKDDDLQDLSTRIAGFNKTIKINSDREIKLVEVTDMSGRMQQLQSNGATESSLFVGVEGVYVVRMFYADGTVETRKVGVK